MRSLVYNPLARAGDGRIVMGAQLTVTCENDSVLLNENKTSINCTEQDQWDAQLPTCTKS